MTDSSLGSFLLSLLSKQSVLFSIFLYFLLFSPFILIFSNFFAKNCFRPRLFSSSYSVTILLPLRVYSCAEVFMKNFIKKYVDGNTLYLALLGINALFPGVVPGDLVDADACSAIVEGTSLMARLCDEGWFDRIRQRGR